MRRLAGGLVLLGLAGLIVYLARGTGPAFEAVAAAVAIVGMLLVLDALGLLFRRP